ncbi:MAG: sigma-70 family RNA polymerase sigma factor [Planctomycetes bacterium]|nr:sigma-70 family RNA polymerase sigma factor [Planctomycetota bacterium]MBL7041141.1 sigma-70 family RNA polymerase sigma factor [Pirellulaceae bacterium]
MTNSDGSSSSRSAAGVSGSTATSLLERLRARDSEGWRRLVDLYGPLVYRWCRQCGLRPEDTEDVSQEVFKAVTTHVAEFRRDRPGDTFQGWLWTLTQNKIRDHLRRQRGKPRAEGGTRAQQRFAEIAEQLSASSITGAPPGEETALEHRAVELARAGVEDRTWQAFWLVTVEGESVADVAEKLEMTPGAVYKAKYRVMRLVRSELDDLIE